MKGSGLEEALDTVYGPNAVTHMISGKAVSRALRGHFLIEAALVNKLMSAVLPHGQEEHIEEGENDHGSSIETPALDKYTGYKFDANEVKKIQDLYEGIQSKSILVSDIAESNEMIKLDECLLKYKVLLSEESRTAKLWLRIYGNFETFHSS